ncbi:MAG: ABC transporter ATP-binding protein [Anaerolineae bacterium]|nr:ABC transporter ATP-binding protein [Anaerolineae bacterium]
MALRLQSPADAPARSQIRDRSLLLLLLRFLSPYKWHFAIVFVLLLCVTGLSLLPPLLIKFAVDGPIQQAYSNQLTNEQALRELLPYGLGYFGVIMVTFILRLSFTYVLQWAGQSALVDLRQTLFQHILKQDMRFFNNTPVGQIVSRLSNDIEALTELLSTSIVMVLTNSVTLIGIIGVMLALNWRLALLSLVIMPIVLAITVVIRKRIRDAANTYHKLVAELLAYINEQFNGMLIVQLFGRQRVSREEFAELNERYRHTHLQIRDLYTYYAAALQLLTSIGLGILLYGGGNGVLAGWATLGVLISFIQYIQRIWDPILNLAEQISQIQTALGAGERIARMLEVKPEIIESPDPKTIIEFRGRIDIEHVTFSYDAGTPVLRDVDIHIPAGQSVAVVGPTGAGKTSLVGLLSRFYDVQQGRILIDGVNIRDLRVKDLRRYVTVVPQTPYCFDGTIADNLRLFDPTITREKMIEAAEMACAAPFIERLPDSYDYMLLPGGANLSHGQRQLLALARALLHNPDGILVLDEATSNIDTETEALIQLGLQRVLKNRTSVVIAHRLSTIREVDRILVLQRGRVVEDGNHEQLLALGGVYARLHRQQYLHGGESGQESIAAR